MSVCYNGDHTPVSINKIHPIPELPEFFQYEVVYSGLRSTYQSAALDSPPPAGYGISGLLVRESTLTGSTSPDRVEYTRTFSDVPPNHLTFQTVIYTFPASGWYGTVGDPSFRPARQALTKKATSKLVFEYQRISGSSTGTGNSQPSANLSSFPLQPLTEFKVLIDGTTNETQTLRASFAEPTTSPTAESYFGSIVGTEIISESNVELWMGNIYVRKTRYVIAS